MTVRLRGGFTLIEVLVALVLSAVVAAGVRMVFESLSDGADHLARTTREDDERANADRFLRALVANIEVGDDSAVAFSGDDKSVTFMTSCATPQGWREPCRISLVLTTNEDRPALVATLATGEILLLQAVSTDAAFTYLSEPSSGGEWLARWQRSQLVPRALGIANPPDTLILRIGDRG